MANWLFGVGDHSLTALERRLDAFQPTLTFYLTGQPHEFGCTIDAASEAGLTLEELVQDVWAWRQAEAGNDLMFRGPLIGTADTLDGSSHMVELTAHSYRERLARWPIPLPGAGNTTGMTSLGAAATPTGLGWQAINLTLPASDLAAVIVDKHVASGTQVTQSAQGGTATDAAIDTLTAVRPFDWDMVPTAAGKINYTTWSPTRGMAKPEVVAMYGKPGAPGSNILNVSRTFDLSGFGNQVWLSGQDTAGNAVTAKASTPFGPEGLWVITDDATNVDSAQLTAQANTRLIAAETPGASYTLSMAEGWWQGINHVWLGDSIQLVIKSGRLNIAEMVRVQQISISPSDGAEAVQIAVGAQPIGTSGEYALVRTFRNTARRFQSVVWHT